MAKDIDREFIVKVKGSRWTCETCGYRPSNDSMRNVIIEEDFVYPTLRR